MLYEPNCKACQVSASEKANPVKLEYAAFQCKIPRTSPNNIHRSTTVYMMSSCTEGLKHICTQGFCNWLAGIIWFWFR